MKAGYTKIVFVVDRSGSMENIARDMEGGFKSFIADQKKNQATQCDVSLYQFDTEYDVVFENKDINSDFDYRLIPRGGTAMNDAIGKTINSVGETLSKMNEDDRPDRVLFVIITDGQENSSKEFKTAQIKEMIERQTKEYNWIFSYLGANQDAWAVGNAIGISKSHVLNYVASAGGAAMAWNSLNSAVSGVRCSADSYSARVASAYSAEDIKAQDEEAKKVNLKKPSKFV